MDIFDQVVAAGRWVSDKRLKVRCGLRWVDWEKKIYSPFFAVLWQSQSKGLNFIPPPSDQWVDLVAGELGIACGDLEDLLACCEEPTGKRKSWIFSGSIPQRLDLKVTLKVEEREEEIFRNPESLELVGRLVEEFGTIVHYNRNPIPLTEDEGFVKEHLLIRLSETIPQFITSSPGDRLNKKSCS